LNFLDLLISPHHFTPPTSAEIAHKFDVAAMPTFVVLKDGEVIARLSGANGERLRELLRGAVESQVGGESASKMEGTDADKE